MGSEDLLPLDDLLPENEDNFLVISGTREKEKKEGGENRNDDDDNDDEITLPSSKNKEIDFLNDSVGIQLAAASPPIKKISKISVFKSFGESAEGIQEIKGKGERLDATKIERSSEMKKSKDRETAGLKEDLKGLDSGSNEPTKSIYVCDLNDDGNSKLGNELVNLDKFGKSVRELELEEIKDNCIMEQNEFTTKEDEKLTNVKSDVPDKENDKTCDSRMNIVQVAKMNVELYAVDDECKYFKIIQAADLDCNKNSWFIGDLVLKDGRLFALIPFMFEWFFLHLFTGPKDKSLHFTSSKDTNLHFASSKDKNSHLFRSVEDTIESFYSQEENQIYHSTFLSSFRHHKAKIESFLTHCLDHVKITEDSDLGFRYNQEKTINYLVQTIKSILANEEISLPVIEKSFALKWKLDEPANAQNYKLALILASFEDKLDPFLFNLLCQRFDHPPLDPNEIEQRMLKDSLNLTTVKVIKSSYSNRSTIDITPNSDYSNVNLNGKKGTTKAIKKTNHNNASMDQFFKKKHPNNTNNNFINQE